ncbi:MAG: hypothetical protein JXQ80_00050 [Bacteroidales bacterium]|nr:hypothetical protein [Bacteroidales bacterium]
MKRPHVHPRFTIATVIVMAITSCTAIQRASYKAEEEHYALYKQKALLVYEVTSSRVLLSNPSLTRCYLLKGKKYTQKWHRGDTMIIDSNLTDFYNLKFARHCKW